MMATAKFHIIGNSSTWYRVRVQEEIHAHNLEGSTIDAGEDRLVVIVEGDGSAIDKLYRDLRESSPEGIGFTDVQFGDYEASSKTARNLMITNSMEVLVELLREIEKNTRKINQKLDVLIGRKPLRVDGSESDEEEHAPESSFAAMFGD